MQGTPLSKHPRREDLAYVQTSRKKTRHTIRMPASSAGSCHDWYFLTRLVTQAHSKISYAHIKALTAPKRPITAVLPAAVAALLTVCSTAALAGNWGESWGRMYWGDNPTSAPAAPTIDSVVADSDTITITMAPYPQGDGTDGWSAVYEYQVVCGNLDR